MQGVRKVRKSTAVLDTLEIMRGYITSMVEKDNFRLPSEEDLAAQLGISRLTVREALTVLEREGLIARFQGRGTIINQFAEHLVTRLDFAREIGKFIAEAGYISSVDEVTQNWRLSTNEESQKLCLQENAELLVVEKRFLADGNPAAFCIDRIPRKLFRQLDFAEEELHQAIFPFVEKHCHCRLTHDVIELIPSIVDEKMSLLFNLKVGTAMLRIDTVEYSAEGQPIMYNTEFYVDQFCRFTLCRSVAYID
ncbi:GntR family transcriptional regulator [Desulfosporosinus lacus]|uniref:GntR family transcriptional regulator n=1 Tax=Desulfosporosinus lacus DSM 15449 TaxID=1121420 RepID=A0A1M5RMS5_9FIRM|nr:GntR family transcriptional regulator [Desulfosporosinus lacus]SHH27604.1 GntR family transcriptional regulator [Desulfosporosinus lacus DSM 15449]